MGGKSNKYEINLKINPYSTEIEISEAVKDQVSIYSDIDPRIKNEIEKEMIKQVSQSVKNHRIRSQNWVKSPLEIDVWIAKEGATLEGLAFLVFFDYTRWKEFRDSKKFKYYYTGDPKQMSVGQKIGPILNEHVLGKFVPPQQSISTEDKSVVDLFKKFIVSFSKRERERKKFLSDIKSNNMVYSRNYGWIDRGHAGFRDGPMTPQSIKKLYDDIKSAKVNDIVEYNMFSGKAGTIFGKRFEIHMPITNTAKVKIKILKIVKDEKIIKGIVLSVLKLTSISTTTKVV